MGGALCAEGALGAHPHQLWPPKGSKDPFHRLTEEGTSEGDKNSNQPISYNRGNGAADTRPRAFSKWPWSSAGEVGLVEK